MSVEALAIALHHSRAKGAAKLVLIGIANHDGDGGSWPSVATLARYSGVSARNVQKALQGLEHLGEIQRQIQAGGMASTADFMRPNLYHFQLRCPVDCDGSRNHRRAGGTELVGFTDPLSVATPGVGSDTPPVSVATPEPSINQTTNHDTQKTHLLNREGEHGCNHQLIAGSTSCEFACRANYQWRLENEPVL